MNILVINGPNLNFLGIREKEIYGNNTYQDLEKYIYELGLEYKLNIDIFQSNHEGDIIDKLQEAYFKKYQGIIINPGAYTHYSYAIRDAIASINIKTIEVHLSDISQREDFRKLSVVEDVCIKTFMGKGFLSYKDAIMYLVGV